MHKRIYKMFYLNFIWLLDNLIVIFSVSIWFLIHLFLKKKNCAVYLNQGHACALHLGSKRHLCLRVPCYSLKQRLWGSREDQCHIRSCILGSSSMLCVKSGNISGSNVAIFLIENLESWKCRLVRNSLAHAHKHTGEVVYIPNWVFPRFTHKVMRWFLALFAVFVFFYSDFGIGPA